MCRWLVETYGNSEPMALRILHSSGELFERAPTKGIEQSLLPMTLFGRHGELIKDFKRLRTLAITSNLPIKNGREKEFLVPASRDTMWRRTYYQRIRQCRAKMMITTINDNNLTYGNIDTATNIYKFDIQVLDKYSQDFKQQFRDGIKDARGNELHAK